jgi:hypothetical protein
MCGLYPIATNTSAKPSPQRSPFHRGLRTASPRVITLANAYDESPARRLNSNLVKAAVWLEPRRPVHHLVLVSYLFLNLLKIAKCPLDPAHRRCVLRSSLPGHLPCPTQLP